jgi:dTDP-glucose pyrophosphorylase
MIKITYTKKLDDLNPAKFKHISTFLKFCRDELDITNDIQVFLMRKENHLNITTGGYNPTDKCVYIIFQKRQIADVLRTIAHELVHQKQDLQEKIVGDIPDIGGVIEDTANALAGRLVKMYVKKYDAREIYSL